MKVLVINTVEFGINGISTIIMNYYRNTKNQIAYDFVINGKIHPSYEKEILAGNSKIFVLHNRNKLPFLYVWQLSQIIRNGNYDIVHIHGNSALMTIELFACKKSKTKALRVVHGHNTDCTHRKLHRLLYQAFIKNYDYGIACSKAAGKWLYGDNEHIILNNGIQEERFQWNPELRAKMREKWNIAQGQFVILHVGLFNEQKNHTFLIDIFREIAKRNANAILRLVGQGDKMEEIRNKVRQYGLEQRVTFVGETLHPEEEYQMADVFVMPSLYESFGLVTVEAQCSGLPCVLSDRIPKEIKVIENVSFLSLDLPAEKWAEQILAYAGCARSDHQAAVIEKGYSIGQEAQELVQMYREIIESN